MKATLGVPVWVRWALLLGLIVSPRFAEQCIRRGNDFLTMWGGWRLVLEDQYLYTEITLPGAGPWPWPNPPSFTFLTAPLGLLDATTAGFVWFYLKLALLSWVVVELKRLNDRATVPARWSVVVPVLLTLCWASYDFVLGHMNIVSIGLMLLSLIGYVEGRFRCAAVCGSLAIISKGPAALLIPFFAARRQFRLALGTLGLCALWVALPAVVWGPAKTWRYNVDFATSVRYQSIYNDIEVGWAENWSLPALLIRVLGPVPEADRYGRALNLALLPRPMAEAIGQGAGAIGMLALLVWWARGVKGPGRIGFSSSVLHHAALAATATLVLSPVTRKAYLITLLLPYLVLWGFLTTPRPRAEKRLPAVLFFVSIALSYLTHADLLGKSSAFFFESWHVLTLSLVLLLAAQISAVRAVEHAEATARGREPAPEPAGVAAPATLPAA